MPEFQSTGDVCMVYNYFIKCQVCGSVTRVRLQVGLQPTHPVIVTCGECGTSLFGMVNIDKETLELKLVFDNAIMLSKKDRVDYFVECSSEFPTLKQCKVEETEDIDFSPFMRTINRIKDMETYEAFRHTVSQLNDTANKWKDCKKILTLSQRKSEYTVQEVHKLFGGKFIQCRDEFETLRAVHMIEVMGFYTPLKKEILDNPSVCTKIVSLDIIQMKNLIEFLDKHNGLQLEELQSLIYKLLDEYIDVYQALIPALLLQYCKEGSFDLEKEGSTTSTFDMVKQFYLDVYEALGNLLIIPVALNNIKYRGNMETLPLIDSEVVSLEKFIRLPKAQKYRYCQNSEAYTNFLGIIVNPKLRNAIGHNDVTYDTVTQQITYVPDCRNRTKQATEYLLQFEDEAMRMFQGVLAISEYIYRLREMKLIFDKKTPIMSTMTTYSTDKIGRNELCPCGSGKKYKFCHGKN